MQDLSNHKNHFFSMVSIEQFIMLELLYRHFAVFCNIFLYFYRTTHTNNTMPFDFESRTDLLGEEGRKVKNKWSCSQVWLGYVRLSSSFIVSRKRIVRSWFRVRSPHVSSALSIPSPYPCHTEILFLRI